MKKWTSCASGVLLAALALQVGGCDAGWGERETPSLETRTFALHHMEASEAANLIGPYIYAERAGAPGVVSEAQDDSPAITVRETADNLDRIAAVLAEFDRPADRTRTLVLKFQLISTNGTELDPQIADVVTELRRFLRFDGYTMAGETFVSLASGSFKQSIRTEEITYNINGRYWPASKSLNIDLHRINVEQFASGRQLETKVAILATSVVIQPGKTLVLGTIIEDNVTAILVVRSLVTDEIDASDAQA